MNRRLGFWLVGGVLFLAALTQAAIFGSHTHEIRLNAERLQWGFDKILPKTKHGVTVESGTITLPQNHADITLQVSGQKLGKTFHVTAKISGIPDYERSHDGDFYFKPLNVEMTDPVYDGKPLGEIVQNAADRYLTKHPGLQNALLDAAPHIDKTMKEAAQTAAKMAISDIPIYRLKDDNVGYFIRSSLKEVRIENGELVATYTLWTFTKTLFISMGAVAVVAMVIVLIVSL